MKYSSKISVIAIAAFSFVNIANAQSVLHEMNARAQQDQVKLITPQQPFDEAATKKTLELGKSNITGVLYTRTADDGSDARILNPAKPVPAAKTRVDLYPVTPYFEEFMGLIKKYRFYNGKQKIRVTADERMVDLHYYVITDEYGRFNFPNLKPGKYMIYATKPVSGTYDEKVAVGQSVSNYYTIYGQVSATHYENQTHTWTGTAYAEKFVEIPSDSKSIEVDVRMLQNPDHLLLKNFK